MMGGRSLNSSPQPLFNFLLVFPRPLLNSEIPCILGTPYLFLLSFGFAGLLGGARDSSGECLFDAIQKRGACQGDLLRHAPLDIGLPEGRSNFISKAGVRKKSHIRARPITMPHIRPISELIR